MQILKIYTEKVRSSYKKIRENPRKSMCQKKQNNKHMQIDFRILVNFNTVSILENIKRIDNKI